MQTINIYNDEEIKRFKSKITDFMWINETDIIPYSREDGTNKGANYTIFVPVKWKDKEDCRPGRLRLYLRSEVDADKITIEYINFVRE